MSNVLIVTPAYDGKVCIPYLESIQSYRNSINFDITFVSGSSLLAKARNDLLMTFYKSNIFTHMLMLDADTMLTRESLSGMLDANEHVIGAPIPIGQKITPWGIVQNVIGVRKEISPRLYSVDAIGTAALMLSRNAVEALIDDARSSGRVFYEHEEEKYEVFSTGVYQGKYWGEDFNLCLSLRNLGFDVTALSETAVAHVTSPKNISYRAPMPVGESTLDGSWEKLKVTEVAFRWTTQEALTRFGE